MYFIKIISAYLFALLVLFMFVLLFFSPILDTALKRFAFSLIPNLYTLGVFYFAFFEKDGVTK